MLWSITLRFEYKVATIKESKDLSEMSIDELQDLSAIHEHCLNSKKSTVSIEDALQSQLNMMTKEEVLNTIKHNQCG